MTRRSRQRLSDALPGLVLAGAFAVFALAESTIAAPPHELVIWRIAAAGAAMASLFGALNIMSSTWRLFAGGITVSWVVLWVVYVVWQDPTAFDGAFRTFTIALAVLMTWYWSRQPIELPVLRTTGATANAEVHYPMTSVSAMREGMKLKDGE